MLLIGYGSESELKETQNLLSKLEETCEKLEGIAIYVDDNKIDEVLNEVKSKIPPERIKIFSLHENNTELGNETSTFNIRLYKNEKEVLSFISFLISRRKGVLLDSNSGIYIYSIPTRKGKVRVGISLTSASPINVTVSLEGVPGITSVLSKEFEEDLRIFGS